MEVITTTRLLEIGAFVKAPHIELFLKLASLFQSVGDYFSSLRVPKKMLHFTYAVVSLWFPHPHVFGSDPQPLATVPHINYLIKRETKRLWQN